MLPSSLRFHPSNPLSPHVASGPTRLSLRDTRSRRRPPPAAIKEARAPLSQAPTPAPFPPVAACLRHRATTFCSQVQQLLLAFFVSLARRSEEEQRRAREEEEDERSQVRLPLLGARLLPGGTVPGAAGDGAAAVRRAAAEEGAELPRRLPGRALLLLLDRRVLLRPIHHLRQLEEDRSSCSCPYRNNGFSSGRSRKQRAFLTKVLSVNHAVRLYGDFIIPASRSWFPGRVPSYYLLMCCLDRSS